MQRNWEWWIEISTIVVGESVSYLSKQAAEIIIDSLGWIGLIANALPRLDHARRDDTRSVTGQKEMGTRAELFRQIASASEYGSEGIDIFDHVLQ